MSRSLRSLVVSLLAALAACSSPEGGGSDAGADAPEEASLPDAAGDAAACTLVSPYSSLDMDCNACAEATCCAEVNACLTDAECNDGYVNCAIACALDFDGGADADAGPTACLDDCAKQYPTGKKEYDTAIGCVDSACAVECQ
jgi:hypothetical protein